MRLLLDANLSPRVAEQLAETGHDVTHVTDLGLLTADDGTILQRAVRSPLRTIANVSQIVIR